MEGFEYMKMPIGIFSQHVIEEYHLMKKLYKGCIWIKFCRNIYGLPQAGKLANEFLSKKLAPHGYFEVKHTPGLWKHIYRPLQFTVLLMTLASSTQGERTQSICSGY